jgi:ribonucleotide reductase beta subunit family protein with ferritin-like domain
MLPLHKYSSSTENLPIIFSDSFSSTIHNDQTPQKEILCEETINRFCLYPIKYPDIWEYYKKHKNAFWTPEDIDFSADLNDWENKLNDNERYFIEQILAFFASSDGIVLENLLKNFSYEITIPEARCFYGFQAMMENIHCCTGDTLILTSTGWLSLSSLIDQEISVWNGVEFSKTIVRKTKPDKILRVTLNNSLYLDCTPEHTWYIQSPDHVERKVLSKDLRPFDSLSDYVLPQLSHDGHRSTLFPDILNQIFEKEQTFSNLYIVRIEQISDCSETFCFYEPLRNRGVFNGILTGQSEVYSLMIDTFIKDPLRKEKLFSAIQEFPAIQKKADWALKWMDDKFHNDSCSLGQRLFAFGIVEGLFFSGSFCAIFWLKERGLMMKSLAKSNEWIARDEGLHTSFAVLLYKYIKNKISQESAHSIMHEAVLIEEEFICSSLPVSLIGMNSSMMQKYIRYVADKLLTQFGHDKLYHEANPFPFMNKISMEGKTNFFEQRVSEYSLSEHEKDPNSNHWDFSL